ncbi:MAG TPA: metallophosphoesterase family protein [Pyrinomonadaceae bacterium]|jgi:serine/threonine protein phosphatase 1
MKTFVIGDVHGRRTQLNLLLGMLPRDADSDTLVFLGDLIDRGQDAPGVVNDVLELHSAAPEQVRCLRGNHEQMMLDFLDEGATLWLKPVIGGERTFEQYTGNPPLITKEEDYETARAELKDSIPPEQLEFIRSTPLYYEDDYALYVHAGLDKDKHPRDTTPQQLLWTRDKDFYMHYRGKPCLFGHTPTAFLPLRGRVGRHGIYIFHGAIGIDTGYNHNSPLSCLQLPDFILYQSFADGHTATHHITAFIPEELRAMKKQSQKSKAQSSKS